MTIDLERALGSIATAAEASAAPVPLTRLLTRVHRRRTARAAGMTAAGVGSAAAVVLGGAVLTRPDPVAPPAITEQPTPTASPSPSPTPDAGPPLEVPAAVRAGGPLPVCGGAMPPLDDPSGDADLHLDVTVTASAELAPDGPPTPLDAQVTLVNGTASPVDLVISAPELLVVRDGVVVAEGEPADRSADLLLAPGGSSSEAASVELVGCGDAVGAGEPLVPGAYEVYVAFPTGVVLDRGDGSVPPSRVPLMVMGGPSPLTLTATSDENEGADDAHPPLAELVVSPSGLGPLAIGVPPATNPGAAMIEWDPAYCEGFDGEPGRWVPSGYGEDVGYTGDPVRPFGVAADDSAVGWIDVLGSSIRTAEGIGIGSTVAELQAAYPELEGPFDGPVSRVWWLPGSEGTLVFETQGDADGLRPAGSPESVILMRVLEASADPAFATANSDAVAGGCF